MRCVVAAVLWLVPVLKKPVLSNRGTEKESWSKISC